MGARGPAPKRPEERRRANKPETPQSSVEVHGPVEIPVPNPRWHKLAIQLYEALRESGQACFFEPSDWAEAQLLAESLSRDLKAFAGLGVSEGDRRRMGITIRREAEKPALATVTAMDDARDLLGG